MFMKAAIYTTYGSPEVLTIADVERPKIKNNEVLIKVHNSTVNRTDCGYRSAKYVVSRLFTGLIKPKRIIGGSEFAGEVVEVGKDVIKFKKDDKVFGFDDVLGGAHAEYMPKSEQGPLAHMPKGTDYATMAAAGEGATYALNIIESVHLEAGNSVLVYGASGAIGSAAVQILKSLGLEVTAVCGTKNVSIVKKLGADSVIDYQKADFTKTDKKYDFIFDAVGKSSYGVCKKLLKKHAHYYSTELGDYGQNVFLALAFAITRSKKVIFPIPKINQEKIEHVAALVKSGSFVPLLDTTYSLDDIVNATRYVESEQKVGNVVIKII